MTAAASASSTGIDLSTTIGKKKQQHDGHATNNIISLTSMIYNASGPRTGTSAAMAKIATSEAGGVLAKSATLAAQKGNDLPW
jgi:dihydroorotate dehydrogenase